jgi:DNA-binding transcriptional ArsR family regulator
MVFSSAVTAVQAPDFYAPRRGRRPPLDKFHHFYNYQNMESKDAIAAFSALSQEVRLGVLRHLVKAGPTGLAAGAIAAAADVPAPTMSFHLKELAAADLIRSRKDGRSVIYAANYGGIRALVDFLLADCCQGDPRLCGPYIVKETAHDAPACSPKG